MQKFKAHRIGVSTGKRSDIKQLLNFINRALFAANDSTDCW